MDNKEAEAKQKKEVEEWNGEGGRNPAIVHRIMHTRSLSKTSSSGSSSGAPEGYGSEGQGPVGVDGEDQVLHPGNYWSFTAALLASSLSEEES
mmetsp:Transcript_58530/g.141141  ORF Transcript_58530/g.141141 Transcript_58530/m.141141 type:complete len:93 (+) Transcript_58530:37-315(+)